MSESGNTSLVAVRDRREQIIEWLSDRFSNDLLEVEEFERRIDLAHQASSLAELDQLVADLDMPAEEPATPATEALVPRVDESLAAARPRRKHVIAIMGGVNRKDRWLVPRTVHATAIMGGISLDFREAVFPPGRTRLRVTAIMGGVEIIVPPHVAVAADGVAIMGGFEDVHRAPARPDPDAPMLVITGVAFMGGVDIKTRLPGETAWQAWKRERRERKQLQRAGNEQLQGAGNERLGDGS